MKKKQAARSKKESPLKVKKQVLKDLQPKKGVKGGVKPAVTVCSAC